jgi:hypothetical protein
MLNLTKSDGAAMAEWSKALGLRPTGHSRPRGFEPRWLHLFAVVFFDLELHHSLTGALILVFDLID